MGERLSRGRVPISKTMVSFAAFANLSVIFLLFKETPYVNTFFGYLSGIAGILFLIALVISLVRNRKKTMRARITERNLFLHYLRTTRKYILISIVGMVLAVMILSQGFLIPQLYEDRIVDAYFGDAEYVESFDINAFPNFIEEPKEGEQRIFNLTEALMINDELYDASVRGLNGTALPVVFGFDRISIFATLNHTKIYGQPLSEYAFLAVKIYPLTERNKNYLTLAFDEKFTFSNVSVISVVSPMADPIFRTLTTYPLLKFNEFGEEQYLLNVTEIHAGVSDKIARSQFRRQTELAIYLSIEKFNEIVRWMELSSIDRNYEIQIFSPVPLADEIRTQISQIRSIENKLAGELNRIRGIYAYYYSPYEGLLDEIMSLLEGIRVVVFLLVAPIMGLGLYLMYFSSTLVERRRKRLLTIMKLRGITEDELKLLFLTEITTSSILATIVGMILSIPWVIASLNSSKILGLIGNNISLPTDWYYVIPLIGFTLTFDVNIVPMFRMAGRDLLEDLTPEEQKKPRWQRYNLDATLLSIGVIDYALFKWFSIRELNGLVILIFILSPFAIIGLFLGFSLFVSRIFAPAIGKFSDFMWIKRGNLFALATRNMRQTRFTSSKFVAFTLFGLMVGYTLILLPANINEYNTMSNYYFDGADVRLSSSFPINSTLINNVSSLPEVESTSLVVLGSLVTNEYIRVMGVNHSTFAATAYWKPQFAQEDLEDLMNQLGENSSNVLLQSNAAKNYDVNAGDSLFLQDTQSTTYDLYVAGIFDYFPLLVTSSPYFGETYMVMNLDYAFNVSLSEVGYHLLVKLKQEINTTAALEKIQSVTEGVTLHSAIEMSFSDTVFVSVTGSILQSSLWLTLLIIAISSLFYSFITLADRKKEIAIFRALGMKERQIFTLLVVETLTVMGVGIILGTLAGFILNEFIVGLIFLGDLLTLPFEFVIPWNLLLMFDAFVIGIAIFSAAYPARRIARVQTGSILRAE